MKISRKILLLSVASACLSLATPQRASASIDHAQATSIFEQAKTICSRDGGALWGHTLCGPMLLVDPDDRTAVANQPDGEGHLKKEDGVYTGLLPVTVIVSDTTVTWAGVRWCELMWPWPMREDDDMRHVTLAHEMFHRIEVADLGIATSEGDNRHLDTLEGRFLIEMEWRALAAALQATGKASRRKAIEDVMLFRGERYRLFPEARKNETALEANEGIAEYTGVRLGLITPEERVKYALRDLTTLADAPSLVRSFAYATGPAYGLLLDEADPNWRVPYRAAPTAKGLDQRLSEALHLAPANLSELTSREAVYDPDGKLRAHEVERDEKRKTEVVEYRQRLIEGAVVSLPLHHSGYQFKPQSLVPIGNAGTVYPTMLLRDDWGQLKVESGGVLMGEKAATVSAIGFDPKTLTGKGFTLQLNPGWTVQAGPRAGDFVVVQSKAIQSTP